MSWIIPRLIIPLKLSGRCLFKQPLLHCFAVSAGKQPFPVRLVLLWECWSLSHASLRDAPDSWHGVSVWVCQGSSPFVRSVVPLRLLHFGPLGGSVPDVARGSGPN